MLPDTVVYSLVVTAEDDEVLFEGQFVGYALIEHFAVGGHVNDLVVFPLGLELGYHPENRFHHHHHTGIAAIAVVVHALPRPEAVFADVVHMDFDVSLLLGSLDYGMVERAVKQLRYYCEYIDPHIVH